MAVDWKLARIHGRDARAVAWGEGRLGDYSFHQQYSVAPPSVPYEFLRACGEEGAKDDESERLAVAGARMRKAGVAAVYLAHGTFVGNDTLGLAKLLRGLSPAMATRIRQWNKSVADAIVRDVGNFTEDYAQRLQAGLARDLSEPIPVKRFVWSSENHHLARLVAAIELIETLAAANYRQGSRVLLWGHSHAGNAFALMSQLLSGDPRAVEPLLTAAQVFLDGQVAGRSEQLRRWLIKERPLHNVTADVVTMGTPIRYAWNDAGIGHLLHVVFHRPQRGFPKFLARFPPTLDELDRAEHGDFVHQIGIAGSNTNLNPFAYRSWRADRRLHKVLQPGLGFWSVKRRLGVIMRVAQSGATLLVDYGLQPGNLASHLAGHGVYTQQKWLGFHAEEITRRLYGCGEGLDGMA